MYLQNQTRLYITLHSIYTTRHIVWFSLKCGYLVNVYVLRLKLLCLYISFFRQLQFNLNDGYHEYCCSTLMTCEKVKMKCHNY